MHFSFNNTWYRTEIFSIVPSSSASMEGIFVGKIFHPLKLAGTTLGWNVLKGNCQMVPRQLDLHLSSLNLGHITGSEFAVLLFHNNNFSKILIFMYLLFKYLQYQPFSFCETTLTLLVSLYQFHSVISPYSVPFFYRASLPSDWLAVWHMPPLVLHAALHICFYNSLFT